MAASSRENLAALEAEIKALVEQEKREEAGKLLFELIASSARKGDLNNANRLRDWFYEVNPMALQDIIKANELIEEAMSGSVDEHFLQAWDPLKQVLSEEEFTSLYHCLEKHQVDKGKQIVKTGSKLDAVFFITKGNVNMLCQCGGKSVPVKVLESGTLISENCFESSYWTLSLVTASPVDLFILRQAQFIELCDRFPGLEAKLTGYYDKLNDISKLLHEQKLDRRLFERFSVDHKITFQTVDKEGKAGERSYRGELDNISRGGLSFFIRIVKRENRRMLFGRRLLVSLENEGSGYKFTGTVVAITIHDFQDHDYAVHVAFDSLVAEETIKPLLPSADEEEEWSPDTMPDFSEGEGSA